MDELKKIIAVNISRLRLQAGMTQQELADKLSYTDKAVSKWERGESTPDVSVLDRIAKLFGVTVDYLLIDHTKPVSESAADALQDGVQPSHPSVRQQTQAYLSNLATLLGYDSSHLIITLMSAMLVWLLAVVALVAVYIAVPGSRFSWLVLIYALPVSGIVILVLNSIWGKNRFNYILISFIVWTTLLSIYLTLMNDRLWILFLIGVPAQAIILMWSRLVRKRAGKAKCDSEDTR